MGPGPMKVVPENNESAGAQAKTLWVANLITCRNVD